MRARCRSARRDVAFFFAALAMTVAPGPVHAFAGNLYERFLLQQEVFDDGDGEVHTQWRWLMAGIDLAVDSNHRWFGHVDLVLREDHRFLLKYVETFLWRSTEASDWQSSGGDPWCPVEIHGQWDVDGERLVLGDLIEGRSDRWHGQGAVKLEFSKRLSGLIFSGRTAVASYGISNVEPTLAFRSNYYTGCVTDSARL